MIKSWGQLLKHLNVDACLTYTDSDGAWISLTGITTQDGCTVLHGRVEDEQGDVLMSQSKQDVIKQFNSLLQGHI